MVFCEVIKKGLVDSLHKSLRTKALKTFIILNLKNKRIKSVRDSNNLIYAPTGIPAKKSTKNPDASVF